MVGKVVSKTWEKVRTQDIMDKSVVKLVLLHSGESWVVMG